MQNNLHTYTNINEKSSNFVCMNRSKADKILTRTCSICNHPISRLDCKHQYIYMRGLGSLLYAISKSNDVLQLYYKIWCKSINEKYDDVSAFWKLDIKAIKEALSIQRIGWRFFQMRYSLLFDAFYLTLSSEPNANKETRCHEIYEIVLTLITRFSGNALYAVLSFFTKTTIKDGKIDKNLVKHYRSNESFLNSPCKRIIVVSTVSAGKSTLINALVGYKINKVQTTACTSDLIELYNKSGKDGVTGLNKNGEYQYIENIKDVSNNDFIKVALPFRSSLSDMNICFIDTPGINNAIDKNHRIITEEAIVKGKYDGIICISDARYFRTNDGWQILEYLRKNAKCPIIFVLNQLDRFKQEEESIFQIIEDYKADLKQIGFSKPTIVPISARASFLSKFEDAELDEEDLFEKNRFRKIFAKEYYNLPSYVNQPAKNCFEELAGITYLENIIKTI